MTGPGRPDHPAACTPRFRDMVDAATTAELPAIVGALHEALAAAELRLRAPSAVATQTAALVDAAALAAHLDVPVATARDYARRRLIPCVWIGRHLRFDVAAVIEALRDGSAPRRQPRSRPVRRRAHSTPDSVGSDSPNNGAGFSGSATGLLPKKGVPSSHG